ncbi:hypothetical protein Dsin_029568 [Dipteronia sinensis]|uniref:Uncharacterized protein n=1 Tax=Dipteronia sinensis TaxID=43782 RepID=A0AAD9ZSY0_9ROSI|nr:hypothetical protein Dsin_029568 [Dipteronia sinensis]
MDLERRQDQRVPERKGKNQKLEEKIVIGDEKQQQQREISSSSSSVPSSDARQTLMCEVSAQVNILNIAFSWFEVHVSLHSDSTKE